MILYLPVIPQPTNESDDPDYNPTQDYNTNNIEHYIDSTSANNHEQSTTTLIQVRKSSGVRHRPAKFKDQV